MTAEDRALVWLCSLEGLEYRERAALLRAAGDPVKLFEDWEKFLPLLTQSNQSRVYKKGRAARERDADGFISSLREKDRFAVTIFSDDYPELLRQIATPPFVLFGEGNRALLKERKFCIVGSRKIPAWADQAGRSIASALTAKFAVVTGFAEGGDYAAISGALPSGKLICVLPTGLDNCYPADHYALKSKVSKAGLLLSEYPMNERVKQHTFHARNRILAGLAEGVLVLSAGRRSGTMITANAALDCGRDVFALPHNANAASGEGCNELIKNGAGLVTGAEDLFAHYGLKAEEAEASALPPEEEKVLRVLREYGELHVSVIAERADVPVYEAAAILSALEIKNLAVKSGGNKYSAVR